MNLEFLIQHSYVFSVEDAAGNSRARERVDGLKKNQAASETRHTGVSARRASPIDRTADHWLTPAAIASRLCEPVRTNAKHKQRSYMDDGRTLFQSRFRVILKSGVTFSTA
jgi:hypothetical protein